MNVTAGTMDCGRTTWTYSSVRPLGSVETAMPLVDWSLLGCCKVRTGLSLSVASGYPRFAFATFQMSRFRYGPNMLRSGPVFSSASRPILASIH